MIKIGRPWQRFGGHRRCGRGPFSGGPFAGGPFAGGPFGGGRCGGGGGHRFWRHFMQQQQQQGGAAHFQLPSDMTAFLGQFKGKELAELVEAHLPEYLRTEKVNEMLNQFKTGEQADKPVDHNVLLENIGKFLREVLSPFGIDCDYFVDKQTTEPSTETKEQPQEATASSGPSTEAKPSAPPTSEATSGAGSASASASASVPPSFGNLIEQLQTMFTPMFQQANAAATSTPTATTNDQQAEEQKRLDECVERMTAMGFVDSNGVLTELIKSKKGDLNQVLDALNPRNYK